MQGKIPVGRNLFSLERYTQATGTVITDIFQPEHPGWFDNLELNQYTYEVTVHEGFVRRPIPETNQPSSSENESRENRQRNEWEATALTEAVHVEAGKDFRLCLILNIMILLGIPRV